ncbi:MAG TPA: FecR domain-containing protein [Longimicrobiales bacterium]|nr:FecR domain-containing protein [Longimicrobiales bacterium]
MATAVLWRSVVPGAPTAPMADETVAVDASRTVRLADGSVAHLAPGTVLERDPENPRRVRLEGRAYFGITHQPDRPFIVETEAGITRVLGTRFDMTARANEMTVVVVEGRVEVLTDSAEVELGPGEESRVTGGGAPVVGLADVAAVTDWLGDVFIFQNTPLAEVGRELEERFDREIVIEDPVLLQRTITAVYSRPSLDEILPTLCRAVDARCVTTGRTVRITTQTHSR